MNFNIMKMASTRPSESPRASRGSFVTASVPRRYADVCERYRTLERHSVAIDAQEFSLAHSLAEKWRDLYVFARTKDLRLAKVKEDFRAVTTEQSEAFQEELKALRTQFYSDGPIAGKVSLEEGVLLMVDSDRSTELFSWLPRIRKKPRHQSKRVSSCADLSSGPRAEIKLCP